MYPALAVAKHAIADARASAEVVWIGSQAGLEAELVPREGLRFQAIQAAGLHGVGWRRWPANALSLARGFGECLRLIRAYRPEVLLVTGGFLAVPAALACWLSRVPVVMYLPDLEPGLALKSLAGLAARVCVTAAPSRQYFPAGRVVVTGYPVRPALTQATRAAGQAHFGLEAERPTVLVTGGSRGARSLNRATIKALPEWLKEYQVIHLSGTLDWPEVQAAQQALPALQRARYHARPFLHEMGLALAAADLVVSRAGASALGEYPLFGLPAVLAPYPYAWRYQKVNADYLVEQGAAVRLDDAALDAELAGVVHGLLADPARLTRMRAAARALAQPGAAASIAAVLAAAAAREAL